ncbi:MAG: hypothetical protein WBB46_01185 [Candidatus Deferrimicrobiaceae bacterium]
MKPWKWAVPCLFAMMLGGALATPSGAQEPAKPQEKSSPSAPDAPADTKSERWPWRFNINVYGWLPKAPVTIKVDGNDVASAPETLDKILDDLDMTAMFEVEVHKGPIGVFVSPVYYKGKDKEDFTGALGQARSLSLEEKVWVIKYGVSYDLGPWRLDLGKNFDSPTVVLQPYGGFLYLHDDIEMKIDPGVLGLGFDFNDTIKFNTPVVGMNILLDLTKRWALRLGANFGGWSVDGVKSTREFVGTAAYRFKMWDVSSKVFAGYRYLHVDYDINRVELHVDVKGPLVGIGWDF